MTRRSTALLAFGLVLILFLALNLFASSSLRGARLDLTENQLYTLSDGARAIVEDLEEPVRLKLYWTESLADDAPPGYSSYAQRVEELLEEFAAASDGSLRVEVIDPEPYSDAESEAVTAGVRGRRINTEGDVLYFGLVGTNAMDDQVVIGELSSVEESRLEYEISRVIHELAHPEKPVLGMISSLPVNGAQPNPMNPQGSQPWQIVASLRRYYSVRDLGPSVTEIDPEIELLLVVHPKSLGEATVYAIDQFVMRGGRLCAMVDPFCLEDEPMGDQMQRFTAPRNSELSTLFEAWGFQMEQGKIAADRSAALQGRSVDPVSRRPVLVDYPHAMELGEEHVAEDEVAVDGMQRLRFIAAGALSEIEDAEVDIEFTPLVHTSGDSSLIDESEIRFSQDMSSLLEGWSPSGEQYCVVARVDGVFPSAFPDGPPGEAELEAPGDDEEAGPPAPEEDEGDHLDACETGNTMVVFADVDLIHERNWLSTRTLSTTSQNAILLLNVLDFLSGSDALLSIRARGEFGRPFDRVEELRRSAEADALEKKKDLEAELQRTDQRINDLLAESSEGDETLPQKLVEEIEQAEQERVRIGRELREVQYELVRDIEDLGQVVDLVNILGLPILIILIAILRAIFKRG